MESVLINDTCLTDEIADEATMNRSSADGSGQ
jgi:hypothetical protein